MNSLLQISLENTSLEELLDRSLDVILSVSWLKVLPKGAIFLVEDEPDVLIMKAYRELNENLLAKCIKVSFGKCLCGKAAATGKIVFADHIDSDHTTSYDGIIPHGHYNVPILTEKKVIGVIVLYLNMPVKPVVPASGVEPQP